MGLQIRTRTVSRILIVGWILVTLAGFGSTILRHGFGVDVGLVDVFSVEYDSNVLIWYTSAVLTAAAATTAVIATGKKQAGDRFRRHWVALGAVLLFLSLNTMARIHERLADHRALRPLFANHGGVLTGAVLALVLIVFARFVVSLRGARGGLAAGALLYTLGQAGGAWLLAYWSIDHDPDGYSYSMLATAGQATMIAGASVLAATLIRYLGSTLNEIRLSVRSGHAPR